MSLKSKVPLRQLSLHRKHSVPTFWREQHNWGWTQSFSLPMILVQPYIVHMAKNRCFCPCQSLERERVSHALKSYIKHGVSIGQRVTDGGRTCSGTRGRCDSSRAHLAVPAAWPWWQRKVELVHFYAFCFLKHVKRGWASTSSSSSLAFIKVCFWSSCFSGAEEATRGAAGDGGCSRGVRSLHGKRRHRLTAALQPSGQSTQKVSGGQPSLYRRNHFKMLKGNGSGGAVAAARRDAGVAAAFSLTRDSPWPSVGAG